MLTLRIDDRLIHTQVIAGWIEYLHLQHIIVANDIAASDASHIMAMQLATPATVTCTVCQLDKVVCHIQNHNLSVNQLIIVGSVNCAWHIIRMLPDIQEINLANSGYKLDNVQKFALAGSVFLTKEECVMMHELCQQNVTVIYQPSPWLPVISLPAKEFSSKIVNDQNFPNRQTIEE